MADRGALTWGGSRVGSGRKPRRGGEPPGPAPGAEELAEAPEGLSPAAKAVWGALAPHAIRQRTLTVENAHFFQRLCELDARGAALGALVDAGELKHLRLYLQLQKQIESLAARFMLVPFGKPATSGGEAPARPNPWAAVGARNPFAQK
jgi:hypothetical protein